jgi:hypothetical protein
MIAYAVKNKNFYCCFDYGHFIDENTATNIINAGLGRLIISLDGASQEFMNNTEKVVILTKLFPVLKQ